MTCSYGPIACGSTDPLVGMFHQYNAGFASDAYYCLVLGACISLPAQLFTDGV